MSDEKKLDNSNKLYRLFLFIDNLVNSLIYQIITVIIIRSIMIIISSFFLNSMVCLFRNSSLFAFLIPIILIAIDGCFLCLIRAGNEFTWFSFGNLFFTLAVVPQMWIISDYKQEINDPECLNDNFTKPVVDSTCLSLRFDYCQMVNFYFAVYLFMVILAHLWIPHKESLNKTSHSTLITIYLAAVADIYDFNEYNNESFIEIVHADVHQFMVLLSCMQFSFTLIMKRQITKRKNGIGSLINYLLGTEAWSVLLVLIIQDLPFFIIRLILIINVGIVENQKLFFFFIKNIFMILVDIYRFITQYIEYKQLVEEAEERNLKEIMLKEVHRI